MLPVRANAAHHGGRMDDEVGLLAREVRADGVPLAQVELFGTRRQKRTGCARFERVHEGAPEKAAGSGDENAAALPEFHEESVTVRDPGHSRRVQPP